jgi:hypothetical protein
MTYLQTMDVRNNLIAEVLGWAIGNHDNDSVRDRLRQIAEIEFDLIEAGCDVKRFLPAAYFARLRANGKPESFRPRA